MFGTLDNEMSFYKVLVDIQEFMTSKYSSLIGENARDKKTQLNSYIKKYILDRSIYVENYTTDELVAKLYREMAEYSILTDYLQANNIEEININAWNDIKIIYIDGTVKPSEEKFQSPQHAKDVVKRILHKSGMVLDNSQPYVIGHINNKIRITALTTPLIDSHIGVACSIRIVNPQKLGKKDFIQKETATTEMLDFVSLCLRYGLSMCVTGSTGSGKTTLMSWVLSTIPNDKRVYTIENGTREFDLVEDDGENVHNNVVHTCTRYSENEQQNIDQEKLLVSALTFNPDVICVGEMKSSEAYSAQEAGRTGHAVITTTHANSCSATYNRMVTLCRMKYDIDKKDLYDLVTEAFPIIMFVKKLEDNSRKVMEITECEILEDGSRKLHTLFRYKIEDSKIVDGKPTINGYFEKVNTISTSLQRRLVENGMPQEMLKELVNGVKEDKEEVEEIGVL